MEKSKFTLAGLVLILVLTVTGWTHLLKATADETVGMAIIEDTNGDSIAVEPTSGEVWDKLVELHNSSEEMWIGGVVQVFLLFRPDPNYPWGFRFKPENITVAEVTAEGLQTTIQGISEDVDYWIGLGQAYVFAKVIEVHEKEGAGDITGPDGYPDGKCNMMDVGLVARHLGQKAPPAPANCDLVYDGKIDMEDIGIVIRHFGETDP